MTLPSSSVASSAAVAPGGGEVVIDLHWAAGRIADCRVAVRRPPASRLLVGKTAAEALVLVPRLFSLCGHAQHAVAAAALRAAGAVLRAADEAAEAAALRREAIGEHLWRLMIDWPQRLQKNPGNATFVRWYRRLRTSEPNRELAVALAAETPPALVLDLLDVLRDSERPLAYEARTLPRLDPALAEQLFAGADPSFAAAPVWQGGPAEVGALARCAAHPEVQLMSRARRPLAARLVARWLALQDDIAGLAAGIPSGGTAVPALSGAPGVGVAWAETARGPLCHRVVLDGERVADYAVIAPTEWNFHPLSGWAAALRGSRADTPEIAENLLRLWTLALDPCVPVRLNLTKED